MKKAIVSILIIVLLVCCFFFTRISKQSIVLSITKESVEENSILIDQKIEHLKGLELITDESFKKDLQIFMVLNSRGDQERLFYRLSKRNLLENFPGVTTADEYVKKIKDNIRADKTPPDYLAILGFGKVKKDKCYVDVLLKTSSEGESYEMEIRYFFVKETKGWMYDTYDPNSIK